MPRARSTPTSRTSRDFPFNGEPVMLYHDDAASDDTDTMVMFRRSDVIVAGDCFGPTAIR